MADDVRQLQVAVLGLGNVLMGDDALGPYVIAGLLARYDFAPGVTVLDLGTPGLDLTPFVAGQNALVIVDTVKSSGRAGQVRLYRRDELLAHAPAPRLSPHDPGVKETLLLLEVSGQAPREVLLVGVVPGAVETGVGLSAAVRSATGEVERAVLAELDRLGTPATARANPAEPDLWWEKTVDTASDAQPPDRSRLEG
jgi:hydrogenase maturation protease